MSGFGGAASGGNFLQQQQHNPTLQQTARIRKLCVVGEPPIQHVINILKDNYQVRLLHSADGSRMFEWASKTEAFDDSDVVFFVNVFETPLFNAFTTVARPNRPVIGPRYIIARNYRSAELAAPKLNRRVYCETMRDLIVTMNLPEERKRRCMDLVHYMNGHVRKEASDKTNILISNEASGEGYRTMVRIGLHANIVRFSWVEECWRNRDRIDFNCANPNLISAHRLGTFEGLKMHFHGLQSAEYEDMRKHLIANVGAIVEDVKSATHIIYSSNAKGRLPDQECSRHAKHVNAEWFWMSINAQHCMLEENYVFGVLENRPVPESQRSSSSRSFDSPATRSTSHSSAARRSSAERSLDRLGNAVFSTPDYSNSHSAEDLDKMGLSKADRRLQVCRELLETETNYINALQLLVKFKLDLESELAQGNDSLMPKNEIAIVFGKVEPIIEVHEKIRVNIQDIIDAHPNKDKDVCEVFTQAARDLEKVYPAYINNYDLAKDLLNNYDEQNPRFHVFRKLKETDPDFKRHTVMELLIRPVQRLPSVILLMKEINKKSDRGGQAKAEVAANIVDKVLKKANEVRQRNDQHIEHLARFNLIDGVPAHLVCSKRSFESECEVICVSGTGRWESLREGKRMMLMLFHDVIIACKIRDDSRMFTRLTRQSSLSSFHRKPYKFFNYIMVQSMRNVQMIEDVSDEFDAPSPISTTSGRQLFAFTIREDTEDTTWIVEPTNGLQMANFNQKIHNRLFVDTGRDFIIEELLPVVECKGHQTTLIRYIKRRFRPRASSSTSFSSTFSTASMQRLETSSLPPPRTSLYRRALSSASFLFTNRFRHPFTRPNLSKIAEDQLESPQSGTLTPKANANGNGTGNFGPIPGSSLNTTTSKDGIELLITPKASVPSQERRRLQPDTFISRVQRTFSRKSTIHPRRNATLPSQPQRNHLMMQLAESDDELEPPRAGSYEPASISK